MKKTLLLACAMVAMSTGAAFADDVVTINFESSQFHQKYYAGDGDWYTTISTGAYDFMFDILAPAEGLVSGQAYTLDDMMGDYSFGIDYATYDKIEYITVSYTETVIAEGEKSIEAQVVATNGLTYNLSGTYIASEEPEMIQMPEGLETIDCVFSCYDIDYGEEAFEARLAFDGSDVYLEGCGYVSYFFQSVIKGTCEGNTLTFPMGQCVGFGSTANYFLFALDFEFNLQDLVLTYDAEQGAYVAAPEAAVAVCPNAEGDLSNFYELFYNIVLTPSVPVAIETVKSEQQMPAKRFMDGKIMINANGMSYDASGIRVK